MTKLNYSELYFVKVDIFYLSSIPEDRRVSADFITKNRGEPSLVPNVALAFMYDKNSAEKYAKILSKGYEKVRIVRSVPEFNRMALLN